MKQTNVRENGDHRYSGKTNDKYEHTVNPDKVNFLLCFSLMELKKDPTLLTNGSRKAAKVHIHRSALQSTLYGFSSRKGT